MTGRRLQLGMVGGGEGAFIGGVHRMAALLDDRWTLVAGAFSADAGRSQAFGRLLGLADERCYGDWREMAEAEARRADRIDAVAIVTPNHLHHGPARAFLDAGIAVICDKPLTTTLADALDLAEAVRRSGAPFVLTHNYSGYAMVRQMRAMVAESQLGAIRVVQAEYAQDWLASDLAGNKQADWRGDPERAGAGGALGDIATHAYHLAAFVTGVAAEAVSADTSRFVPGRRLDDDVQLRLRWVDGARGQLWASQVAIGVANGLRLRIYGDKAGIDWRQEEPNSLWFRPLDGPAQLLRTAVAGTGAEAAAVTRVPSGHPEGYVEAFANIFREFAELLAQGEKPAQSGSTVPGITAALRGMAFVETAVASSAAGAAWHELPKF